MDFSDRLKALREESGLSQKAFAEKLAIPHATYRSLEQGVRKPLWETVLAISQALGVDCRTFSPDGVPDDPDNPPTLPTS